MAIVLAPKAQKQAAIVPDGSYKATLSKVTQFTNTYGLRIGFEFALHGKGVEGQTLMRSTNSELTLKSKLTEVLK